MSFEKPKEQKLKPGNVSHPVDPGRFPEGVTPSEAEKILKEREKIKEGKGTLSPEREYTVKPGGEVIPKDELTPEDIEAMREQQREGK